MIKVHGAGLPLEERLIKIEQSINRSPVVLAFPCSDDAGVISVPTGGVNPGGFAVDRSWSQTIFPDAQWVVRAAGFVDPVDANGVLIRLVYQKDDATKITLGSITPTGAGFKKVALGPFDIFATGSVPSTETIPVVRLIFSKVTSGTGSITNWTIWLELRSPLS